MKQNNNNFPIMGNSRVVRNINRSVILNIIRERQPISRVQIARLTGLNKSTVSSIVPELIEEGFVTETLEQDKNVGRNPLNLRLTLGNNFVGAIAIENAVTRLGVADVDGSLKQALDIPTERGEPDAFIKHCLEKLGQIRADNGIQNLKGIGISVPGIVDPALETVLFAPQLGWENFAIGELVRRISPNQGPVAVNNDANSAALAELWFGKHDRDLQNFVFVYVGNGIGCGIIIDKKLIHGAHFASGEFGHIKLFEGGEMCSCGNHGCWEAYAANEATSRRYQLLQRIPDLPALKSIIGAALDGETEAVSVLQKAGHYLGSGIANIIKALDPAVIIIGGEITEGFDIIHPEIVQALDRNTFFGRKKIIQVLPASINGQLRLSGAAALATREMFNELRITG